MATFLRPLTNVIKPIGESVSKFTKNKYRLGYEIEFFTPNATAAYDYIRQSGVDYVDEYTTSRTRYSRWQVKHDRSIQAPRGTTGVEIASPPMNLEVGIASLLMALDWIKDQKAGTNDSCGLHVSISMRDGNVWKRMNPIALLYNFDEDSHLKKWKRFENRYCQPTRQAAERYVNQLLDATSIMTGRFGIYNIGSLSALASQIGAGITKHHAVNLIKMQHEYIEFRLMGGADYHLKRDMILETTMAIVAALDKSIDSPTPAPIRDKFTVAETSAKKVVADFEEKMKTANEKKANNRKLLAEMHKAANRMEFIQQGGSKAEVEMLVNSIRTRINTDASPDYLQNELQLHQATLATLTKINASLFKRTVEAA